MASSMASERECWRRGTLMSSKACQSGREAEAERAATTDPMWGEQPEGRPSIIPTNSWEQEVEARKVAGAWRKALQRLTPPTTAREGSFQPGPLCDGNADNGIQRLPHRHVEIPGCLLDVARRGGRELCAPPKYARATKH